MAPRSRKKSKTKPSVASVTPSSQPHSPEETETKPGNLQSGRSTSPPSNSQPPSGCIQPLTNEEELLRACKIAANAVSTSYRSYGEPEHPDQKEKYVFDQDKPSNVGLLMQQPQQARWNLNPQTP
ncbi:hypothetical protein KEM48_004144 [Puccinia striiformis f. sp. tritici PST-130]|uniref:Uncharacterized protein n=1 Tax=Puccinia striiformis f. sp. tritici PST-78 TaxID=1165861 RepID=A0A0L0UXC2_9BASI|nr:hypothetical protein H4Q26_003597 [Puccinia striiformis f. sp. tritici PST-130]KAI9612412.1 hypothetical protein KEM48_004144 [Puccinia striiformis f. sp. tritici PST-130]KNE91693.1 hypothetical protein PSTG_14912 [Puccinia striiformis f. sp. tritici PST-78]